MSNGPIDIIETMITALQADATLIAFNTAQFGKQPKFYIGFDDNDMPPESDCPYIAFMPGSYTQDPTQSYRNCYVNIAAVHNSHAKTTTSSVTRYTGLSKLENWVIEITRVLSTLFNTNYINSWQETGGVTDLQIPFYRCSWQYILQEDE